MQKTKSALNSRSLRRLDRKKLHVGGYPGTPVVKA
jgi:hypothetical protein